jgi:ribbon-helix-helix CopG family protein
MTPPKRPYTLKIDPELLDALRHIKDRDGISESEQIRRGIKLWLAQKSVAVNPGPKQAERRKRPK